MSALRRLVRRGAGPRARQGYALLLVVSVLSAMVISGAVMASRASVELHQREADAVRRQALWLARSALTAGLGGERRVETPQGPATVSIRREGAATVVVVTLEGQRATVVSAPYAERYGPAAE